MTLGNVNAKILIEKAVQDYYRYKMKLCPYKTKKARMKRERMIVRRIAAFEMHYAGDLTLKEIAKEVGLGLQTTTVRSDIRKVVTYLNWYMKTKNGLQNVAEALQ